MSPEIWSHLGYNVAEDSVAEAVGKVKDPADETCLSVHSECDRHPWGVD